MKDAGFLKKLYYQMLRIRRVEEKLTEWCSKGFVKAPVHLSIGQEAVAVGVMSALEPDDKIVSTHRCHAHYLAKGGDMKAMFSEILGKATGCCKGKGGTMHLFDDRAGHIVSSPLVGASIPFAVGLALAAEMKGKEHIAVAFFGDGAVEEGIFWESVNFAAVRRLPVLFVCENNLYATHIHIRDRQPNENITSRVKNFIDAQRIDNGNDVLLVADIAKAKVGLVRRGIPCFIEACTYRLREHWGVGEDWHLGYRSREEGEEWKAKCPFKQLENVLETIGTQDEYDNMSVKIDKEIQAAEKFAMESPKPFESDLMSEVGGKW